jgi:ribonuclease I
MKSAVFIALLAVGVFAGGSFNSLRANNSYAFLLFEMEWPPTNCLSETCPSGYEYQDFNIHGLWPSYADGGSGPEYCSSTAFYVPQNLQGDMEKYWRSDSESDTAFW